MSSNSWLTHHLSFFGQFLAYSRHLTYSLIAIIDVIITMTPSLVSDA